MCGCSSFSRRTMLTGLSAVVAFPSIVLAENGTLDVIGGTVTVEKTKRQGFDGSTLNLNIGNDGGVVKTRDQIFYLDPETEAEFYNGSNGLISDIVIKTGGVLSLFGAKNGRDVKISTTNAVGAIRGTTTYFAWQEQEQRTYVCCCYGGVDLSNNDGGIKSLDTRYHTAVVLPSGGGVDAAPYDKPLNHYDDDIVALEKLAGRTPRWTLPNGQLNFFAPTPAPLG